jgi:hypothetical protein
MCCLIIATPIQAYQREEKQMTDKVIFKEANVKGTMANIYLMDVPVVYASIQEPKDKYTPEGVPAGSLGKEYNLTAFVDKEQRDYLFDEILVNKSFFEVGNDKNKKRKIKYPLTTDEGEASVYAPYAELFGCSLTQKEFNSKGKPNVVNVIDADGEQIPDLVGNGSRCNIKLFAYKNSDDQWNVSLDTVQVIELVKYEGKGAAAVDDVLGVKIEHKTVQESAVKQPANEPVCAPDDFDDSIPF